MPAESRDDTAAVVLTPGEPAGIGPDLTVRLAAENRLGRCLIVADPALLAERARQLKLAVTVEVVSDVAETGPPYAGRLQVAPVSLQSAIQVGRLDPDNAGYVLETLRRGVKQTTSHPGCALVTGPVHKGCINEAGFHFSGHTEFLAALTGSPRPVMLLAAGTLRVALATTHIPLRAVADSIQPDALTETLEILNTHLRSDFRCAAPHILVAGLNPHAGEGGHLGHEEREIIEPVLKRLQGRGMNLTGPWPADTLFTPDRLATADAVLAMYHDQGLPVLKHVGFGEAVNITLGLPLVRTSVDHGTALELAGRGQARTGSLEAALGLARELATARAEYAAGA